MAVASNMMELGTQAPDFTLPDTVSGQDISLINGENPKATLVMFICNHCPYVIHIHPELINIERDYRNIDLRIIAISSNDVTRYPQDGPVQMKALANQLNISFPYLYDESQEVARAYDAACTPDFYLFDENLMLKYRGRLDDSRPRTGIPLSGKDLRSAIDAVLSDQSVNEVQYPSMGCSIKWKN